MKRKGPINGNGKPVNHEVKNTPFQRRKWSKENQKKYSYSVINRQKIKHKKKKKDLERDLQENLIDLNR